MENPDLPITVHVSKTAADATNLIMLTNCWAAGVTSGVLPLDETLTDDNLAKVVRTIIAGKNPGGTYVNFTATTAGNFKMSVQEISDGLDVGAGNAGTETQRVSISTDDVNLSAIKTAVEIMDDWDETNRAAVNLISGQVGIAGGTGGDGATVPRVTLATDVALPAGTNLVGDVGIGVRTSGGTSIFRSIDLDEGALEVVKGSAGQIYWLHVMNLAMAMRFVKIYNATSGTIGTGTPDLTFPIPTQGDSNGAGFTFSIPNGIAFSTGISIGASTGIADADTGAPGANEVVCNLGFA
jgi:hypothetical protein